jgi:mRNA interferase MazF
VRGDVHLLRAPRDACGDEQRGLSYAVVLQSDHLAELSTWLVAPTSTSALPLSFRPRIEVEGQPTLLLLVDQLAAADSTRLGRPAGRLTADELAEADAALRIVLGLR